MTERERPAPKPGRPGFDEDERPEHPITDDRPGEHPEHPIAEPPPTEPEPKQT